MLDQGMISEVGPKKAQTTKERNDKLNSITIEM